MQLIETIEKRRSVRKFKSENISDEIIDQLIYYGSLAPSAKNKQHWYFVIVKGDIKDKIGEKLLETSEKGSVIVTASVIKTAPVLILVFNNENDDIFAKESIGAAIQNILLAATDLDLGSLWIGYVKKIEEDIKKMLNIDKELVGAIAIGKKDEEPNMRPRKSLEEIRKYL